MNACTCLSAESGSMAAGPGPRCPLHSAPPVGEPVVPAPSPEALQEIQRPSLGNPLMELQAMVSQLPSDIAQPFRDAIVEIRALFAEGRAETVVSPTPSGPEDVVDGAYADMAAARGSGEDPIAALVSAFGHLGSVMAEHLEEGTEVTRKATGDFSNSYRRLARAVRGLSSLSRLVGQMREDRERLTEELREINESYDGIMAEACSLDMRPLFDERSHCTCVPALRNGIHGLRSELAALQDAARALVDEFMGRRARSEQGGHGHGTVSIATLAAVESLLGEKKDGAR